MEYNEDERTRIDPMRIAWLLRADLRKGAPAGGPVSRWFKMWWLINGPREYPAWTNHKALGDADLFSPLSGWPSSNGFGMSQALHFLLEVREDLARIFDVQTDSGLCDANAWLFAHGVREHSLYSALDEKTLAALDATHPFAAGDTNQSQDAPNVTWLMYFVWKSSSGIQKQFNLQNELGRRDYLAWFLSVGVPDLKLGQLLAPRWRQWLRAPVMKTATGTTVPRAAHLLWKRHQQLQKAFDLQTDRGITGLAMWAAEVWENQPELSWIDASEDASTPVKPSPTTRPFGINLIGFAFGELGIGEDVRMAVAACEAAGIPFSVVNVHPGDHLRQADLELADHVAKTVARQDPAPYMFNLFCLTAFDTARIFLEQGSSLFDKRYNIGWWPWELPVWPNDWAIVFDLVDEVWAATTFTQQMYIYATKYTLHQPPIVKLMPMPASVDRVKKIERTDLGLPLEKFLFLYVFDSKSYIARKNPLATVNAFREAFDRSDETVGLVLKTMNADVEATSWKKFVAECEADGRIVVIDQTMDRESVLGLIEKCDVYISLHRSEGLGRTLAEAMLFGKPVIATNFSGNVDFLAEETGYPVEWVPRYVANGEYPYVTESDQAWWADPKIKSAAHCMKLVKSNILDLSFKKNIQRHAREFFSPITSGERISKRLNELMSTSS